MKNILYLWGGSVDTCGEGFAKNIVQQIMENKCFVKLFVGKSSS